MALRLANSLLRTSWLMPSPWRVRIEKWELLAALSEFRDATLAIVGNAGYLVELNQGNKIDRHDLVLRMNNFRTAGFESQVGQRTDIFLSTFYHDVDLTNPAIPACRLLIASVPFNHQRDRQQGILQKHAEQITQGLTRLGRRQVFVPEWEYFLAQKQAIGKYPTSGAMALLLATQFLLGVCRSVYVTGFSFFSGPSHYFSNQQVNPRNHAPEREQQFIRELLKPHVASGRVTLDERMQQQLSL
jgi:hypothetical protein